MYDNSDSDSVDSDKGIRYKTDSIRNKKESGSRSNFNRAERRRSRSRSRHSDHKRKKSKKDKRYSSDQERSSRHRDKQNDKIPKKHKKQSSRCKSSDYLVSSRNVDSGRRKQSESVKNSTVRENHAMDSVLPLPKKTTVVSTSIVSSSSENSVYGPLLPPSNKTENLSFGPVLPPNFKEDDVAHQKESAKKLFDPTASPNLAPIDHSPSKPENKAIEPGLLPKFKEKLTVNVLDDLSTTNELVSPDPAESSELRKTLSEAVLTSDFIKKSVEDDKHHKRLQNSEENSVIGPVLPPDFEQKLSENNSGCKSDETCDTPDMQEPDSVIGPSLPPELRQKLSETNSNLEESSDEEVYGPVPIGSNFSKTHIELEERALKMKIAQLGPQEDEQPGREEWMLTLPEAKAARFGLGPRTFRAKAGPDLSDRSSWTDTPEEKAKKQTGKVEPKVDLKKEAELKEIRKRDREQEAVAKKHKKHKNSLLEIHQKKIKKGENESGPSERRPFSRETDLQVNRFDDAQKKTVLKKAQLLDTRFSSGESKYL